MITDAMKNEGDVAKRTAVLMAAFGKAGNALVPMLGDLDEQMANASKYGNIISPEAIAISEKFNDTITRLKMMTQAFGDVIRSAVVQYITPLLGSLQEWAAENREVIGTKLHEFASRLVETIKNVIAVAKDLWPSVKKIAKAFGDFMGTVWSVIKMLGEFMPLVVGIISIVGKFAGVIMAIVAAWKIFNFTVTIAKAVMLAFNITASANPIGLIVLAIAAAVAAFALLSSKVGGVGNAFKVLGQTIMKWVLTPINMILTAIGALLGAMSHLPFIGDTMKAARDAVGGFQNTMNTMLTGSESTLLNSGPGFITDPYKEARARELENQAAKREITTAATDPELLGILNRIADADEETAGNTKAGKAAASKAPGLVYAAAGNYDLLSTVRQGL
jgi:hypothetical protein